MDSIKNGWTYISTIFDMLMKSMENENSIIEPQYIFRGISKRFLSRSRKIEDILKRGKTISDIDVPKKIKDETLVKYKEYYNAVRDKWNKELQFESDPSIALEKLREAIFDDNSPIAPEYIKSGAAVRLQEVYGSHSHHIDYINYIKHMLNDVKSRFPKYVDENYSDIEILADLQHKGAASCLVDFSNNFLTSLWFATETYNDDIGYLFCYDINKVTIEEDKLSILDAQKETKGIIDLLYETTKTTKYSGKQSYKFWLWKPSNLNERIARQDSVFVFGLEAFSTEEHHIKTIPIPPTWKKPIQLVLKQFFGITGESIYCDIDGYADANAKLQPYDKTISHYFNEKCDVNSDTKTNDISNIQNGMSCLFQSEYELGLKYFSLYESTTSKSTSYSVDELNSLAGEELLSTLKDIAIDVDLHYSKAVCHKHLKEYIAAIIEYKSITDYYDENLNTFLSSYKEKHSSDGEESVKKYIIYFENKYQKTINDLMDMYYDTRQYDKILEMLNKIGYKDDKDRQNIESLKCTTKREIACLKVLEEYILNDKKKENISKENISFEMEPYERENCNFENIQPYYFVLNMYFDCIMEIMKNDKYDEENEFFSKFNCFVKDKKTNGFGEKAPFYSKWNFDDLDNFIEKIKEIDKTKYVHLAEYTSRIKDYGNFIQGKAHIEPW